MTVTRRWLGVSLLGGLLLVFGAGWLGVALIRARVERRIQGQLASQAVFLARLLEPEMLEGGPGLDDRADRLSELLRLPVTIVGADGEIVGDSRADAPELARLPALAGRPEFRDAVRGGRGEHREFVPRLGEDTLHLAARMESPDGLTLGVVRISVTRSRLREMSGGLAGVLPWLLAGYLLVVSLIAWLLFRRLGRKVERLRQEVSSYTEEGAPAGTSDPLDALTASVRRVRATFLRRIEELIGEKSYLSSALESMREGVLAVDPHGRVALCNQAARDVLGGTPPDDLIGRPLLEVTRQGAVRQAYTRVLKSGEPEERKVRLQGREERFVDLRVVPLVDSYGARAGALGVFFDVTRLETLEGIRRSFVADVSHELRTPLTSVQAAAEMLADGALTEPETAEEFLDTVLRNTNRMRLLVDDLTDLNLIESGAVRLRPQEVDLAGVVSEAVEGVSARAEPRRVRVVADVAPGTEVRGDRGRLVQVVLNLADNAVKFSPDGGEVSVQAFVQDGSRCIVVEDEGPGIPVQDHERVFHRFYRVDKGRSRELGGTGLGLSIVKHLVRLHGGTVRVENRNGGGARFVVALPAPEDSPLRIS